MLIRFRQTFRAFALATLAGAILMTGCGDPNLSPLAPEQANIPSPDAQQGLSDNGPVQQARKDRGAVRIGLSPTGGLRLSGAAAKQAGVTDSRSASGWFTFISGGSLSVHFFNDNEGQGANPNIIQVSEATFTVPSRSMQGIHEISMTVHSGTTLDDVYVSFGPDGLTFNPHASLVLHLVGNTSNVDVNNLVAYHIYADGTVEEVPITVQSGSDYLILTIDVPGFSDYEPEGNTGGGG